MTLKILCIFTLSLSLTLLFIRTPAHAISMEQVEVNFAKAELAYIDQDYELLGRLLKENISFRPLHKASYELLVNYHLDLSNWTKAMKVYYYMIKELHGTYFLNIASFDDLKRRLDDAPLPDEYVLGLYYEVALLYYTFYESELFGRDRAFDEYLLKIAKKFYLVTSHYRYKYPQSKYYIGVINTRLGNEEDAITDFLGVQKLIDQKKVKSENFASRVEAALAESLLNKGKLDGGTLLLKNLLNNPKSSEAIKDFAQSYLDSFDEEYFSFTATLGTTYESNLHFLDNSDLSDFDSISDFYGSEGGTVGSLSLSSFFLSERVNGIKPQFNFSFTEERALNRDAAIRDLRIFNVNFLGSFYSFKSGILQAGLDYQHLFQRESADGSYETGSSAYTVNVAYTLRFRSGSLKFDLQSEVETEGDLTLDNQLSLSYTPFESNWWWSPTYELNIGQQEESDASKSITYGGSFSNALIWNDSHYTYPSVTVEKISNSTASNAYLDITLSLDHSYSFKSINGLTLNPSSRVQKRNLDDGSYVNVFTIGSTLSYSW